MDGECGMGAETGKQLPPQEPPLPKSTSRISDSMVDAEEQVLAVEPAFIVGIYFS